MTKETGTLKELNVKPGDVVETCYTSMTQYCHTIASVDGDEYRSVETDSTLGDAVPWRIISRASDDEPKKWRDMTGWEKSALLLAHHEGKVIEAWGGCEWYGIKYPAFADRHAYRVRPEPKRETVTVCEDGLAFGIGVSASKGHIITFDTIDGKPDCTSVKMKEL